MSTKEVYYRDQGLSPALARRYFGHFGPVRRVLDVGCGTGDLGRFRPDPGVEVCGVDIDEGAVRSAAEHERAQVCDLEGRLPFEDAFFDAVLAKDILEHLARPWETLQEIRRVLKRGGALVVSVPMALPRVVWDDYTHVRGYTRNAIRTMLEDGGFTVRSVNRMGSIPGAGRLGLVNALPTLLRAPGMTRMFGSSWEAVASRREGP